MADGERTDTRKKREKKSDGKISRAFRNYTAGTGDLTRETSRVARASLSRPSEDTDLIEMLPNPADRFERVMAEYYGLDEAGVRKLQKRTFIAWLGWMTVFGTLVAVCGALERNGYDLGPFGIYTALVPAPYIVPLIVKNAFLNWQVRRRELRSFREWISMPREWFPDWPDSRER